MRVSPNGMVPPFQGEMIRVQISLPAQNPIFPWSANGKQVAFETINRGPNPCYGANGLIDWKYLINYKPVRATVTSPSFQEGNYQCESDTGYLCG